MASEYNQRIFWWDKNQPMISLTEMKEQDGAIPDKPKTSVENDKAGSASVVITTPEVKGNEQVQTMNEVVVQQWDNRGSQKSLVIRYQGYGHRSLHNPGQLIFKMD